MEYKKNIPFEFKRFFMVHNVPSKEVRGEYAKLHLKRTFADSKGNATTPRTLKVLKSFAKSLTWKKATKQSLELIESLGFSK